MEGMEGVITAMELARRKAAAAQSARAAATASSPTAPVTAQTPPAPQTAAPVASPQAAAAQPSSPQPPASLPHHAAQAGPLQTMFEDGNSLLKAIVASEILGPPAALRERHLWNQPPNEPSISAH